MNSRRGWDRFNQRTSLGFERRYTSRVRTVPTLAAFLLVVAACGGDSTSDTAPGSTVARATSTTTTQVSTTSSSPVTNTEASVATMIEPPAPIIVVRDIAIDPNSAVTDIGGGFAFGTTWGFELSRIWAYDPDTHVMATREFGWDIDIIGDPIGPVIYLPPAIQGFLQTSEGAMATGNTDCETTRNGFLCVQSLPEEGAINISVEGTSVNLTPPDCNDKKDARPENACPATGPVAGSSIYASVGADLYHYTNDGTLVAVIPGVGTQRIYQGFSTIVSEAGSLWILLPSGTVYLVQEDRVITQQEIPGSWTIAYGASYLWAAANVGGSGPMEFRVYRLDPETLNPSDHIEIAAPFQVGPIAAGDGSVWVVVSDLGNPLAESPTLEALELRRYDAETLELIGTLDLMETLGAGGSDIDFFGVNVTSMVFGDGLGFLVGSGSSGQLLLQFDTP